MKSGFLNNNTKKKKLTRAAERKDIKEREEDLVATIERLHLHFQIHELCSISQLRYAWDNFRWGETIRLRDGSEFTKNQEWFCFQVAMTNDLKLLRWVREDMGCAWDWKTCNRAVMNGNFEMLKYCVENGCEVHNGTMRTAAYYGHLDCLKYLRKKNCDWTEKVCEVAHERNNVDVLTYAVKRKCPGFEAYEQYVPRVPQPWQLEDEFVPIGEPTPLWKLITDHPDIFETHVLKSGRLNGSDLKMFYNTNTESRNIVKRAKIELQESFCVDELSSISTLELAWEEYPWGEEVRCQDGTEYTQNQEDFCSRVAQTNDLKLLRWAREVKECDWDYWSSTMAAFVGNLDILKYCVENGCEVEESTCANAALNGHLDCLEYLRAKKCPWDARVCEVAHKNNKIDILTYAVKNKCPGYEEYKQFVPSALQKI